MEFMLGVIASLVASFILIIIVSISKRWRMLLSRIYSKLVDGDIEFIYKDKADAEKDMHKDIIKGKNIAVFTSRGNEFQRKTFSSIFVDRNESRRCTMRILLPKTSLGIKDYDWTKQREDEVANFDSSFGQKLLHKQIETNVEFLEPYVKLGKVQLKRYNSPHIGRIVYIDGVVYFTPYAVDLHGRDSAVYKYKKDGNMSKNYYRYFEQLWNSIES